MLTAHMQPSTYRLLLSPPLPLRAHITAARHLRDMWSSPLASSAPPRPYKPVTPQQRFTPSCSPMRMAIASALFHYAQPNLEHTRTEGPRPSGATTSTSPLTRVRYQRRGGLLRNAGPASTVLARTPAHDGSSCGNAQIVSVLRTLSVPRIWVRPRSLHPLTQQCPRSRRFAHRQSRQ